MGEYWGGKECAQGKDSKISPEGNMIYMLFVVSASTYERDAH